MRRHEADRRIFCDLGMTPARIIPAWTAKVMWTPRLIRGAFGLDVFLQMILRRECDSDRKKPKAHFLSSEVKLTSVTMVGVVSSGDLFPPTLRAATMPRDFHCLLRYC